MVTTYEFYDIYIYIYCPHLYCQVHRPRNVGIDKPRGEIEKNIDTTKLYTYVHIYILGGTRRKVQYSGRQHL